MEPIKITLCPACGACPAVEITDNGVTIGTRHASARKGGRFRALGCSGFSLDFMKDSEEHPLRFDDV